MPLALAGSVLANPLLRRDDACLAAVTGKAALGDDNLRSQHCSSFIKTIVTPSAQTVTVTITDNAPSTTASAWKRDVTVCPNEVPNYASACNEDGYKSACGVFGISGETTFTIPATTTTKTVYLGTGGSPGVCTSTAVITSTKSACSGGTTTATVTETKESTSTKTVGTATTTSTSTTTKTVGAGATVTETVTLGGGSSISTSTVTVGAGATVTLSGSGSVSTVTELVTVGAGATVTLSASISTSTVTVGAGATVTISVTDSASVGAGATVTVSGSSCSSTATSTVTVTSTGSISTGTTTPSTGQCIGDAQAQEFIAAFTDLLQYTSYNGTSAPQGRGYHYNVSAKYLASDFQDYSDSINWMAGYPLGGVTFNSRQAFDYGQGLYQPELVMTTLSYTFGCNTVTWRWSAQTSTYAHVTGINFMTLTADNSQIQTNYAEFNNADWIQSFSAYDTSISCVVPGGLTKASKRSTVRSS